MLEIELAMEVKDRDGNGSAGLKCRNEVEKWRIEEVEERSGVWNRRGVWNRSG